MNKCKKLCTQICVHGQIVKFNYCFYCIYLDVLLLQIRVERFDSATRLQQIQIIDVCFALSGLPDKARLDPSGNVPGGHRCRLLTWSLRHIRINWQGKGERLDNDPSGARYGCFLPDLTRLARHSPAPTSRTST